MTKISNLSRRHFIVGTSAIGAGLSLGVLSGCKDTSAPKDVDYSHLPPNPEVNAWVHIHHDDTVTVRIARSEMGQGTSTGLAQLVAEELDCDWEKVAIEFPTPGENLRRDRVWKDFSTGGSQGLRGSQQYVREGGAAARQMLIGAAAAKWEVPADECTTDKGMIFHKASANKISYGAVAEAANSIEPPAEVTLKSPEDWNIIGQPKMRLDTADKLTGKLQYGHDVQLDGMVMASVKACPILGGKLKSFDAKTAEARKGVKKVIQLGDNAVAVVADSWWTANQALEDMPIEWDGGEYANYSTADIEALLDDGIYGASMPGNMVGDSDAALKNADKVVEASYNFQTLNHACMETMTATALWTEDKCEVWCPTQNGESVLAAIQPVSGHDISKCDVYKTILGGGFGRKGMPDYAVQAVMIAKEMPGTPVKLIWSREEDMAQGFFHPITKAKMRGGLDAEGNITGLDIKLSGQSILATLMPQFLAQMGGVDLFAFQGLIAPGTNPQAEDQTLKYTFPAQKFHHAMKNPPIRPGFWRGVNLNQNAIYLDCFLDEMAHAAGRDPLEFRLAYLKDSPEMAAVLQAVADKGGWGKDDGRHRGLACIYGFGSYVAACADVTVSEDGKLKINKITAATDCGHAANPQQIEAQVEGSFVYGLSAMLFQEITYENGQPVQTNFHNFSSMRIADMPEVETIVMPSGGFWGGVGEPTIAVAAPAVLNAIFAATGKRARQLPLKDQNLRG